jgi:hypothetical protein
MVGPAVTHAWVTSACSDANGRRATSGRRDQPWKTYVSSGCPPALGTIAMSRHTSGGGVDCGYRHSPTRAPRKADRPTVLGSTDARRIRRVVRIHAPAADLVALDATSPHDARFFRRSRRASNRPMQWRAQSSLLTRGLFTLGGRLPCQCVLKSTILAIHGGLSMT